MDVFDFLGCRSGTKGKCGEVDTVFTTGVSSRGVQSFNTDPGQNSGRRCTSHISDQKLKIFIMSAIGRIYQLLFKLQTLELKASNSLF